MVHTEVLVFVHIHFNSVNNAVFALSRYHYSFILFFSLFLDQQNFNVSVENMLTRCLDNERHWHLHSCQGDKSTELLIKNSLPLIPEKKADTLVFPCILSALQWITHGRDSVLTEPAKKILKVKSSTMTKASSLYEAAAIHILITGSLHLVGGVLKHLDPASSM